MNRFATTEMERPKNNLQTVETVVIFPAVAVSLGNVEEVREARGLLHTQNRKAAKSRHCDYTWDMRVTHSFKCHIPCHRLKVVHLFRHKG